MWQLYARSKKVFKTAIHEQKERRHPYRTSGIIALPNHDRIVSIRINVLIVIVFPKFNLNAADVDLWVVLGIALTSDVLVAPGSTQRYLFVFAHLVFPLVVFGSRLTWLVIWLRCIVGLVGPFLGWMPDGLALCRLR